MKYVTAGLLGLGIATASAGSAAAAGSVCLITKDATNPFS